MPTEWLDSKAAAAYAKMNVEVIAKLARAKKIKAGFDGKKWRFKAEFIDEFLLMNGRKR